MPSIKVGLAQGKTSYYDPNTNTYITLSNPVQSVFYDATTDLSRITHALLASVPALVLYEGDLPQEAIDAWTKKYDKIMHSPTTKNVVVGGKVIDTIQIQSDLSGAAIQPNSAGDRAARVNDASADVTPVSTGDAEEVNLESAAVEAAEEKTEKPATKGRKAAAKK